MQEERINIQAAIVILIPTSISEVKNGISAKPPPTSDEYATMLDAF
jgi:hypothetical protein